MINHRVIGAGIAMTILAPLTARQEAFRGSLAQYLALDEKGVAIGKSIFHNFRILPLQEGAEGFSAQFIDVVPLTTTEGKPGFRFEIMDGATVDDFFELRFSFEASGTTFESTQIELNSVNVRASSNGSADVLLDLAVSGNSPGSLSSLIAFAAPEGLAMLEDKVTFAPQSHLSLEVDAVLDGGNQGAPGVIVASLGAITVTLTEAPPLPARPVVKRSGVAPNGSYFIEFTSTPSTPHLVTASTTLTDDFPIPIPLPDTALMTDRNGFARVEIDLSTLPSSAFFSVKKAS
ncbi:hypothetical protein V2O64_17825 [Verrucomicrobiaceae bacterium 227]